MRLRVAWLVGLVGLLGVAGCAPPKREPSLVKLDRAAAADSPAAVAAAQAGDAASAPPATATTDESPEQTAGNDGYELDSSGGPRPLDALCKGPWRGVGESHPYRGVRPEDNGGGECCPLADRAFLCVVEPGHQHQQTIYDHARFFDGDGVQPRFSFTASAAENLGMSHGSRPMVHLEAVRTPGGFALRPSDARLCRPPSSATRDLCKAAGSYTLREGIPVRSR